MSRHKCGSSRKKLKKGYRDLRKCEWGQRSRVRSVFLQLFWKYSCQKILATDVFFFICTQEKSSIFKEQDQLPSSPEHDHTLIGKII